MKTLDYSPFKTIAKLKNLNFDSNQPKKSKEENLINIQEKNKKKLLMSNRSTIKREPKSKLHPLTSANKYQQATFAWLNELIWVSRTTPWTQEMNYDLEDYDRVATHKQKLISAFKRWRRMELALIQVYGQEIIIFCLVNAVTTYLSISGQNESAAAGDIINKGHVVGNTKVILTFLYLLGFSVFLALISSVVDIFVYFRLKRVGIASKAAFYSYLQEKIMKFSPMNSKEIKEGYIANLVQIDAIELGGYVGVVAETISNFITAGINLYYIIDAISLKFSIAFIVVMLATRVLYLCMYVLSAKITSDYLKAKDARMGLFKNVLENVEYVKINGLEDYFSLELYDLRETELFHLKQNAYLGAAFNFYYGIFLKAPSITIILLVLYFDERDMGYLKYLFYLQLSDNFNSCLTDLFMIFMKVVNARVSLKRIDKFLISREIDQNNIRKLRDPDYKVAVEIKEGNFKWRYTQEEEELGLDAPKRRNSLRRSVIVSPEPLAEDLRRQVSSSDPISWKRQASYGDDEEAEEGSGRGSNQFYLREINIQIKSGDVVIVLGESCSGRSSLLYAILGEMIPLTKATKVIVNGNVGFLSQGRWLLGMSIRDNITLGKEYDEATMEEALRCSQLIKDLDTLKDGLDTLIGDNGDTISGGQKARIALARVFYQE